MYYMELKKAVGAQGLRPHPFTGEFWQERQI